MKKIALLSSFLLIGLSACTNSATPYNSPVTSIGTNGPVVQKINPPPSTDGLLTTPVTSIGTNGPVVQKPSPPPPTTGVINTPTTFTGTNNPRP